MTPFTLWFTHHQPLSKRMVLEHEVGITTEEFHVKTSDGEFWMTMNHIVEFVIENGNDISEEPAE